MLSVSFIRQHTDLVKQRLAVKNFKQIALIDEIVQLDDHRKQLQFEQDDLLSKINAASKEIGQWMAKGETEKATNRKSEVAELKAQLNPAPLQETEKKIEQLLYQIPNLPSTEVPEGKGAEDNVIVRKGGTEPLLGKDAQAHWDLAKKFDLIDFELGNKITGSGFPVYTGQGAKLQRSLIQYFLDFNTSAGYKEFSPPHMVNEASAYGTGQLPDKEGQMYHVSIDNLYLIPTAEVPVTNIYRDSILKESDLPIRMTAYTPCFRREAGSYGKDVRGLNRLHQFDKVEIVQLVQPVRSYDVLNDMVLHVEKLIQSLELQYRILKLCGGDMGFASALTFDFEVFSGAQQKWLEVSSVSNFENYQTNRMKARYKDSNGKTHLLHSLNGSSLALPRIMASILENNQQNGSIRLPEVLHPYFGASQISLL